MKQEEKGITRPRLRILSDEQKKIIFDSVLQVLENTGVRVDNDEGLELLKSAGARVTGDRRVRIPANLVENALKAAPKQIDLYNTMGDKVVTLGSEEVYYCSQVDSTYFFDPFDQKRRHCVRSDARLGALLCDALSNIHMVSFSALYNDVPGKIAIRLGHKDTVINCTKPLMHGTADFANLKSLAEMAAVIVGSWEGLAKRPYYLHYAEPQSPLVHSNEGVQKLLFCATHRIPVIYASMTIAGATAPVTGAGNIVNCIAESLSGLVMAQQKNRGAPFVFGGVPTVMDMSSTIVSYGAPEMLLWSAALVEMADYLGLPVSSTAGCTDSVLFDEQAAAESAMSCLMATLSGASMVHDVGFTEAANSASLELIAATDEFISAIGRIASGLKIIDEHLGLGVIDKVGSGRDYLGEEHTLKHFRENWRPQLFNRGNYAQWKEAGALSLYDKANKQVRRIISEHQPQQLHEDVIAELDRMERNWWKEVT